ncbi:MAG TPA: amidohydrolase family protein [Terriglobales bacterium]|nr:amidohydrolase family protein [Terriglobales bacterium]
MGHDAILTAAPCRSTDSFLRADQAAQIKELGIFSPPHPRHTFYWGDGHRESVAGPERAENISPTGWVAENGMKFSIHSDAPVTFPNSMRILDTAVNRTHADWVGGRT